MKSVILILGFILLSSLFVAKPMSEEKQGRISFALEKFYKYSRPRVSKMPLDTLFSFNAIAHYLKKNFPVLAEKYESLKSKGIVSQKRIFPEYYKMFKPLVKSKFAHLKFRELGTEFPKPSRITKNQKFSFNEQESDACLKESTSCLMTERCFNMETTANAQGYTLTHQIIYFQQLYQCKNIDSTIQAPLDRILPALKQKIADLAEEIKKIEASNPNKWSDLFVERYFIMMLVGYGQDFVNDTVIDRILSRQQITGCWGNDVYKNGQESAAVLMDTESGDSCSFHFSGIAASILAFALDPHN